MSIVMYSAAMTQAIAAGDLKKMKALLAQAEEHLSEWGNIPVAYEALKIEIAKLEYKKSKKKK